MIDVEQRPLRSLEHDGAASLTRAGQEDRHVGHPRRHALPGASQVIEHLAPIHRRFGDQAVACGDVVLHGVGERRGVRQVADPDAAPRDLVFVSRTNAARGRANTPFAAARFAQEIELTVVRQDQMGLVADVQPAPDVDAGLRQLVDLREECRRIDDDAVADHARDAGMQNAGRQKTQDELAAVRVDGVAGVVAALIARDNREVRRQQIDNLALALVAPLRSKYLLGS